MNTEIEIKAWADDPAGLKKRIPRLPARQIREYDKLDIYFRLLEGGLLKQELRLRSDAGSALVTLKDKQLRNGLEINAEREFTVSEPEHFTWLLDRSGYKEFIRKRKTGTAWQYGRYLIELSEVEGLGFFVELEWLTGAGVREEDIQQADKELRAILSRLEIPDGKIEPRRYTAMLAEKQGLPPPPSPAPPAPAFKAV